MERWRSYKSYLEERFHVPVYRIGIDGGFSCPNRDKDGRGGCSFCDGTGAVAVYHRQSESGFHHDSAYDGSTASRLLPRLDSIESQIERGREFLARRYGAEMFSLYFQSFTNTYDSIGNLERIYGRALSTGRYAEFIVSTRPDSLPDDVIALLSSYRTDDMDIWVELGLQSGSDETLRRIGRGHDVASYIDAAERLHRSGIKVSTHIIIGLPGEDREDYERTAKVVGAAWSEGVKIHNLHIAGGTRMADEYLEGLVTASSEERYLEDAELVLRLLSPDTIIQRLVCETPAHRLIAPRSFPDKSRFLSHLKARMERRGTRQGDLYGC